MFLDLKLISTFIFITDLSIRLWWRNCSYRKSWRKKGQLRLKPPFPANVGVFVNQPQLTTLEQLLLFQPSLEEVLNGFQTSRENTTGSKIFCISGDVNTPCNVEEELEFLLNILLKICRWRYRRLGQSLGYYTRRFFSSTFTKSECENVLMDFDSLKNAGSVRTEV